MAGPGEEVVDAFKKGDGTIIRMSADCTCLDGMGMFKVKVICGACSGPASPLRTKWGRVSIGYETHLPAIVSEFSSSSLDPFFTILQVSPPLVHGYAPSGRPTRCMASVTRMKPSGWASYAILIVVGCR